MKVRTAFSLTALLAGASLGWAQGAAPGTQPAANTAVVPASKAQAPVNAKPATFMDAMRAKQASQTTEVMPGTVVPASMSSGEVVYAGDAMPMNVDAGNSLGYQFWGSAEMLLWRIAGSTESSGNANLPAIQQQVPYIFLSRSIIVPAPSDPDQTIQTNQLVNIYGLANVSPVLFAGTNVDSNDRTGWRLNFGVNLNEDWAVELSYFQLERRTADFLANAAGQFEINNGLNNILLQDPVDGVPTPPIVQPTVFNPIFTETVFGRVSNRMLGFEMNARGYGYRVGTSRIDALVGIRYLKFEEEQGLIQELGVQDATFVGVLDGDFIAGVENFTVLTNDLEAENRFLGVQAGLFGETRWFGFFLNGTAKIALGGMRQDYSYFQDVLTFGAAAPMPTNVYPYPTNFAESRTRLAWLPELTVNAGYDFADWGRCWVGYNWLYVNRIVRPSGNGLPINGNGTVTESGQQVGAAGPAIYNFSEGRVVAHGLTFGLELRY